MRPHDETPYNRNTRWIPSIQDIVSALTIRHRPKITQLLPILTPSGLCDSPGCKTQKSVCFVHAINVAWEKDVSVSINHNPLINPSPAQQVSTIRIYTDGACSGNPGPGGWGVLILTSHASIELSGSVNHTTNNRMEMLAVIKALQWRLQHCPDAVTTVFSDSQYVIRGITEWIHGWIRNGWKTAGKKPVENQDLWQELWALVHPEHALQWQWVRGHNQHRENEHADRLARTAIYSLSEPKDPAASSLY